MAKVRIVLAPHAVEQLLRGDEMKELVTDIAESIAAAAGPGHIVDSQVGKNRARAAVITDTFEAVRNESKNHSLTRAIDAGRR